MPGAPPPAQAPHRPRYIYSEAVNAKVRAELSKDSQNSRLGRRFGSLLGSWAGAGELWRRHFRNRLGQRFDHSKSQRPAELCISERPTHTRLGHDQFGPSQYEFDSGRWLPGLGGTHAATQVLANVDRSFL